MAFLKKHRRGKVVYYELVEGYRDEEGKVRHRHLKWYGQSKTPPPEPVAVTPIDFGVLAFKMMDGSLTPQDVFDLLEKIGKKPAPLPELEAVGVRFDFFEKTLHVWLYPKGSASKRPPRAPRAAKRGASKRRATGRAS